MRLILSHLPNRLKTLYVRGISKRDIHQAIADGLVTLIGDEYHRTPEGNKLLEKLIAGVPEVEAKPKLGALLMRRRASIQDAPSKLGNTVTVPVPYTSLIKS